MGVAPGESASTLATAIALVSVGGSDTDAASTLPTVAPVTERWSEREPSIEQLKARVGRLIDGPAPLALLPRLGVGLVALALIAVPPLMLLAPAVAEGIAALAPL